MLRVPVRHLRGPALPEVPTTGLAEAGAGVCSQPRIVARDQAAPVSVTALCFAAQASNRKV
jgi:hypothetical protein